MGVGGGGGGVGEVAGEEEVAEDGTVRREKSESLFEFGGCGKGCGVCC